MFKELEVIDYINHAVEYTRVMWLGRRAELIDTHGFVLGKSAIFTLDDLAK